MAEELEVGTARLHPPRILQLYQELVRVQAPAIRDRPDVVVVDDEQIADGTKGPTQARVRAERFARAFIVDRSRRFRTAPRLQNAR